MPQMKFNKEMYSRIALIKAAYNFTDKAYLHLDADEKYYYVDLKPKQNQHSISSEEFVNEMLTQSVRHEVYLQTKDIRSLLLARAMASSVIVNEDAEQKYMVNDDQFAENKILKDWFDKDD